MAKDKKEAKKIIEAEYNKSFPLRVLSKDLDKNEFLLMIQDMTENKYLKALFKERKCKECQSKFRRIDLYNDANSHYKGTEYCSGDCKDKGYERTRYEINGEMFDESGNVPVIYKITNKKTDKCYIGQTIQSFTLRWWQHVKWGKSDCKFHQAMKGSKLTDWKFEVIDVVSDGSKEKLDERESFYIKYYDSINDGYNTAKVEGHHHDKNQKELC